MTLRIVREKLRIVRSNTLNRKRTVVRKLREATGNTPNDALVLSAAKYYTTLRKLAKT